MQQRCSHGDVSAPGRRFFLEDIDEMNTVKMVAILLMVAGTLGLVYGGFSYTKETQEAKLGPIVHRSVRFS